MMRESFAAISLPLIAVCAMAQTQQAASAAAATSLNDDRTIHYKGAGVVAPELLSINGKFDAIDPCKKLDGEEQILIAVDRTGTPQMIKVLKSLGNDLDDMASQVVERDKFKPGKVDGDLAIVAVADNIKLQACRMEKEDESGHRRDYVQLRSEPEQTLELINAPKDALTDLPPRPGTPAWDELMRNLSKINSGATAPVLIHQVDTTLTGPHKKGICMIGVVIDSLGFPQDPHVVKSLGPVEDESALDAVKQFRFKPAKKNGVPVPVKITVLVNVD